ncbi:DNA-3-methyladenine glycosylase family protein [Fodinibius salsisoli]|uniref:DNA-3-methyladenine glycosylase II n=1 Tax=Fodinibius salsisoli TaxID=2820877 RepID=A0ABT3PIB2_9BACT|nr:DNA-3-methyladenine glycosylase [Fodinibius salsisoli]MCW9705656.1 DNA-3-methyladenine glycosylase 2 family protein [Fodinibius salsisoli]
MNSTSKHILLPKPNIFSFSECLHFLDRGYDDCLYTLAGQQVLKPLRINGEKGLIEISETADALKARLLTGTLSPATIKQYITHWFDLERDLQPFYRLLNQHQQLSKMSSKYHGLRLMGIPDLFEALCWCVIGQQINLTFAYRLKRRLVETYGTSTTYKSEQHFFFPDPEVLATLTVDELREKQFSRRKAEYIIGIARQFAGDKLSKHDIEALAGSDQRLKRLTKIRGVGPWTANYVLMKSLQQSDCITYGDTGLQSAVSTLLELDRKPTKEEIDSFFEPFAGWESYLNIYLWRTLS